MKYLMPPPSLRMRDTAKDGDMAITVASDGSMILLKRRITERDSYWEPIPYTTDELKALCVAAWRFCHVEMIEGRMPVPLGVHPKLCHKYIRAWEDCEGDLSGKVNETQSSERTRNENDDE